ncbi:MAG: FtsX-like permease family protein [Sulfurimicrobium sp.]|nr:FtsX-like permease family protein [Sulfurimicrobium sp.]MDP2200086.1 FtsX-like permease family protein [Sulfurimicrobium sp.]
MNLLRLSWRMLLREWRAGELHALSFALLIAVGGVSAVGFFTDRVNQALTTEASQLLAADLVLAADHEVNQELITEARRRGLTPVRILTFPSMVVTAAGNQLAEIKAVAPGYPLRGKLRIQSGEGEQDAEGIPEPGKVWLDPRLLAQLNLAPGDSLSLGNARLQVAAVLSFEPDRGGGMFSIAPRLMMNAQDLPATALIQPGSRIGYRTLLAGQPREIAAYRAWATPRLSRGERIEGVSDGRPEIRSALERGGKFLNLAALTSLILAAVAIVLSARRFLERHLDGCAVMRCVGASQAQVFRLYLYQFLWLGVLASLAGCLLGYGAQWVLARQLGGLVAADLPAPSWVPLAYGLLTGVATLLGFALPFLQRLKRVPPLWVLRRELGGPQRLGLAGFAAGIAVLLALLLWQAGEIRLGLYILAGLVSVVMVALLLTHALIRLLAPLRRGVGVTWRYGLANLVRRRHASASQVMALGLGLTALLILTLVRGDLLHSWQSTLPQHAPNRFVINIQPDQVQPLQDFLGNHGMASAALFPMVRGRLLAINDRTVSAADFVDDRAKRLVEREFNLSWAEQLQNDNQIVAGRWWGKNHDGSAQWSVEEGIAKNLGIRLGDKLTYQVAGQNFSATVTSLRKVDWDSFHVNFFVIATPALLQDSPASHITAFYLPAGEEALLNGMVKAFPNLTVIDVAALMNQVRAMMERIAATVEFVFLFTLAAGLMALYAAISATREERMVEAAIMRTLGASGRQLLLSQLAEFILIGLLAGTVAALAATGLGYVLATQVFHLPYQFNPWLWVISLASGVLGVTLAGWLGTRGVLRQPPLQTLGRLC